MLPVIARIVEEENLPASERSSDVRCLVVVPSQELAMQIVRQVERVLGEFGKSITQQCIGGANVRRQEEALRRKKPLLVVGTPGRLAELSRNGILRTHGVRCLVIDEADDLLASNFRRDMARICDHTGRAYRRAPDRRRVGDAAPRDPAAVRVHGAEPEADCGAVPGRRLTSGDASSHRFRR